MNTRLLWAGSLLVLIVLVYGFSVWQGGEQKNVERIEGLSVENEEILPWIEVVSGSVSMRLLGAEESQELLTGDEIPEGVTLTTSSGAYAIIYFGDGSVIRLDENTELALEEGRYNESTENFVVRVVLTIGNMWSKIVTLATPGSVWEVKTSNAVATVRGTAFGMSHTEDISEIIGAENTVEVTVVDNETNEEIENARVFVGSNDHVVIGKDDVGNIKRDPEHLRTRLSSTTDDVRNRTWVRRALEEDQQHEERLRQLRDDSGRASLREELKERVLRERTDTEDGEEGREMEMQDIPARELGQEEVIEVTSPERTAQPIDRVEAPTSITEGRTQTQTQGTQQTRTPSRLVLQAKDTRTTITEGEMLTFSAMLVYTDGSRKDVTAEAVWSVVGEAGVIQSPGVFVGKLAPSIAERGSGFAVVLATWKNPRTGATIFSESRPITVEHKVVVPAELRG